MTILQMVVRAVRLNAQDFWRKTRMNVNALWLAFRIWQHNKKVRQYTFMVNAYMAKGGGKHAAIINESLRKVREQEAQLHAAALKVKA